MLKHLLKTHKTLLIIFLLTFYYTYGSTKESIKPNIYDVHKNAFLLTFGKNITKIDSVKVLFNDVKNYTPLNSNLYHRFENNCNYWVKINCNNTEENLEYLSLWNHYYKEVEVFQEIDNVITQIHQVDRFKNFGFNFIFFRLPTWKIKPVKKSVIYMRLMNKNSLSSLKLVLQNENSFLSFVQKDTVASTFLISILIALLLVNVILFISDRNFGFFWYAFFILTTITDFLAYKGHGPMLLWKDSSYLITNFRTIVQTLSLIALPLFFLYFYRKKNYSSFFEYLLKFFVLCNVVILLCFYAEFLKPTFSNLKFTIIPILRIQTFFIILFHIVLAFQRKVPVYLALVFSLPLFLVQLNFFYEPTVHIPINFGFVFENLQYIATLLEIIAISVFIISEIIKEKKIALFLKTENLQLINSMNEKFQTIEIEQKHNLLNNVHDSFGGYIEALKLRLLSNNESSKEKLTEILDAFYLDYRKLLNNLHSPTISSKNFEDSIKEFCTKMDQNTSEKISCDVNLKSKEINQKICIELYSIVSELLTNAIKHAKSSKITISIFNKSTTEVVINVTDNGVGFNSNSLKKGFGLENMKNRIKKINGNLKIDSTKKGTSISVLINLPNNE